MDAKATVEEMVEAIQFVIRMKSDWVTRVLPDGYVAQLAAASDYLLAAESQLAEHAAQIKRTEALVAARDAQIVERELQIAELQADVTLLSDNSAMARGLEQAVSALEHGNETHRVVLQENITMRAQIAEMRKVIQAIHDDCPLHDWQIAELGLEANDATE